jgi:hypothetical protein
MEELTKNIATLNMAHEQQKLTNARTLMISEELTVPRTLNIKCEELGKPENHEGP